MRVFIIGTLDLLAILLVVLSTVGGGVSGLQVATQQQAYGQGDATVPFVLLGVLLGFLGGVLVSGSILALTEIARNTRRMVEMMEKASSK